MQVAKGPVGSKNKPREPAKPARVPETPTPLLNKLTEKARSTMGKIKDTAGEKNKKDAGKDKEKDKDTKQKAKSAVVNVEEDDDDNDEDEYEYYSSSEEPPAKKQKKDPSSSSKKQEEMDVHGWKKRAVELKVTRENKSLRRQLSSERAKKSRKSRSWKKAVKSLLEAGSDSSTSKGDDKK